VVSFCRLGCDAVRGTSSEHVQFCNAAMLCGAVWKCYDVLMSVRHLRTTAYSRGVTGVLLGFIGASQGCHRDATGMAPGLHRGNTGMLQGC
jgi:hypothetical protein